MALDRPNTDATRKSEELEMRNVSIADLKEALVLGIDDFNAMPSHAVFLVVIYPVVGLTLFGLVSNYDLLQLLFPLISGFACLGPVTALAMYELSRHREKHVPTSWQDMRKIFKTPSIGAIIELSLLLLIIFILWMGSAQTIYWIYFGDSETESMTGFVNQVLFTSAGWSMILVGTAVGFVFAVGVFWITVVSFPLLLDRNVSATNAVITSARVCLKNPGTMTVWGLTIVALLVLGSLPALVGLAVVLPILGHASWHLYRKAVV
mgnify:CR=1 FL=1